MTWENLHEDIADIFGAIDESREYEVALVLEALAERRRIRRRERDAEKRRTPPLNRSSTAKPHWLVVMEWRRRDEDRLRRARPVYEIRPLTPDRFVRCATCNERLEVRPGCTQPTFHRCASRAA